jgi:ankyrin repeat protein|tara:strand:+ start:1401 stop:1769 length:369 start_codon:yes stop_codon:yes gene_type:complete
MKHLLLTTIAAVVLVGCGPSEAERALVGAAGLGDLEAVKQHLAAGVDVNAKNKNGTTPLHRAAYYGRKETAELLIAKGADVNAKDKDGDTPLDYYVESKAVRHTKIDDLLRKHGGKTGEELK